MKVANAPRTLHFPVKEVASPSSPPAEDANLPCPSSWCEAIYINCNCSCLGFLSKKRLLSLPKSVGPGSVRLVLREVLSRLIGLSFKSGSVLKRLEYDESMPPRKNFCIETLKGKSKVLHLKGQIEIPTLAADVDAYCQEICTKVGACPYLISTKLYEDVCPASCKTNEVQVGRPKKRRSNHVHNNSAQQPGSNSNNNHNGGGGGVNQVEDSSSFEETDDNASRNNSRCVTPEPRKKHSRREWSELLPKSEIQTRGAKIPNWKVHLKIRPSKKDQTAINASALGSYSSLSKRFKQLEPAFKIDNIPKEDKRHEVVSSNDVSSEEFDDSDGSSSPSIRRLRLRGDPSLWTPLETASFLAQTLDCSHLARFMYEDQIDGPAFLLLNFPTVKEHWSLKNDTAVQLCHHVESVKLAYANKFYD